MKFRYCLKALSQGLVYRFIDMMTSLTQGCGALHGTRKTKIPELDLETVDGVFKLFQNFTKIA